MQKVKVGIVGNGNISPIYLQNLTKTFEITEVKAVCDLIPERSAKAQADWDIPVVYKDMHELFADPEIEIVVNLTTPKQHFGVAMEALKAGKNTHSEKPMSVSRKDAVQIKNLAKEKNLRVGCAPDTFMGAGIQTCRKLLDDGYIGKPIGATAFMCCHGHESWHPDPEFYYEAGGGPMLDMGPYYVTALVNLLGPVKSLTGMAKASFDTRTITNAGKYGKIVQVEVPTHVNGLLEFECGAIGSILTTFDVWAAEHPWIEIFGTEGTMWVPDPNGFDGPVRICRNDRKVFEMPLTHPYKENCRGIAVADMAYSLRSGRKHRASGELAFHVLDIMEGIIDSSVSGSHYTPVSTCERPAPMPMNVIKGRLDE